MKNLTKFRKFSVKNTNKIIGGTDDPKPKETKKDTECLSAINIESNTFILDTSLTCVPCTTGCQTI